MTTPTITAQQLAPAPTTDRVLLDVRTPGEFAGGTVPGAHNIPLDELGAHATRLAEIDADVVLICQSGGRARQAAEILRQHGHSGVQVLEGGMEAYRTLQSPAVSRAQAAGWSLERQVRLVAGSVVAGSVALSVVKPAARFLAGGIGAGLTFAALTNTCAMGSMLAKLPHNRAGATHTQATVDALARR